MENQKKTDQKTNNVSIRLAKIYESLFKKKRMKAMFGGRGGGRSHNVARYILIRAMRERLRIWCAREIQNSISDSVQHLFIELINLYHLEQYFKITDQDIVCLATGSYFMFKGFRGSGGTYSAERLKAYEDFDILWVEEASACSMESLNVVSKTIRKEGSELLFTFNRVLEEDPVWRFTCYDCGDIYNTGYFEDDDRLIIYANVERNEFATSILYKEQEQDKKRLTVDEYNRIWLGYPDRSAGFKAFFTRDMIYRDVIIPPEEEYSRYEVVCGFDPNGGGKDSACAVARQGRVIKEIQVYRDIKDPLDLAELFLNFKRKHNCRVAYCDRGYGQAVLAIARQNNEAIAPVDFGGRSSIPETYGNKRAEIYGKLKNWLIDGGYLGDPKDEKVVELKRELQSIEYNLRKSDDGKIYLCSKDEIRKRIGRSPDCISGDAIIKTIDGDIKVEDISIGSYLTTPLGYAKVIAIHKHYADTVEWKNGLRMTLDHKVYTDKGFKRLRNIKEGDKVYLWKKAYSLTQMLTKLYLMAKCSVLTLAKDILYQTLKIQEKCSTDISMKKHMGIFQKAIIFITKTAIQETTRLKILKCLQQKNILATILEKNGKTQSVEQKELNNLKKYAISQKSGIKVKLVSSGILNTQRDSTSDIKLGKKLASSVEKSLIAENQMEGSARTLAQKKHTTEAEGRLLNARCVGKNTKCINISKSDIALKNAQSKREIVYNITLDRYNCYYANGVLVANCADALALTFAGFKDKIIKKDNGLDIEDNSNYSIDTFANINTLNLV